MREAAARRDVHGPQGSPGGHGLGGGDGSRAHYVEEVEEALKALYALLNLGGSMIFNYPSRYTRWAKIREITPNDEKNRRRFDALLARRNLTSQRMIEEALGARPRRFYSSRRHNIYALVRKIK